MIVSRLGYILAAALTGCAVNPAQGPVTARAIPTQVVAAQASHGSLYSEGAPMLQMFTTDRASRVGDLVWIRLEENTRASRKGETAATKSQTQSFAMPTLTKIPVLGSLVGTALGTSSDQDFSGNTDLKAQSTFYGTLAATVLEVFPNGNLLIGGEKKVQITGETEVVRFRGVVARQSLDASNQVSSSRIADMELQHDAQGALSSAQVLGWLSRFFWLAAPL